MKIHVENLSHDVTEDDLMKKFGVFGEISYVKLMKNKFTGESKGVGLIEMPDNIKAQIAINALKGQNLKGKPLKLAQTRSRFKVRHDGRSSTGGRRSIAVKR